MGHPNTDAASSLAPSVARRSFTLLLSSGCVLAGVTHMAFGILFHQVGVQPMATLNIASVLIYLLSALLLRQDKVVSAMLLMIGEVVGHAVMAIMAIGWDSGFHYYLMITIPVFLANQINGWPFKITLATAMGVGYVLLDWYWQRATPAYQIAPDTLAWLHVFNLVTTIVILSVFTVQYVHLISQAESRLQEMATTDSLTGLMNRRSLLTALEREQALRQRRPHPVALMLVDIDHFKRLNDTYGHNMGDWALQAVAEVLRKGVRDMDFVARWGGEEFLIILPHADMAVALPVAERLRRHIAELRFPSGNHPLRVTATLGLAELGSDEGADAAIQRADAALYQGKHQGRDRVVMSA